MPKSSELAGLRCLAPNCLGLTNVLRTNHTKSGSSTRRLRICRICGVRWETSERIIVGPNVSREDD